MDIIEKLVEFGYTENKDFEIFGDRENIDIVVIGECHCSLKLEEHQIEIIKEFKPKIIGMEHFNEENINDIIGMAKRRLNHGIKEYSEELDIENIINNKELLKEKYKLIEEKLRKTEEDMEKNDEHLKHIHEIINSSDNDIDSESESETPKHFEPLNLESSDIEYLFKTLELASMVEKYKAVLKILKKILEKPNIDQKEIDEIINKYVIEEFFEGHPFGSGAIGMLAITEDIQLVVIDDDEAKSKFMNMIRTYNKNADKIIKMIDSKSNDFNEILSILQKINNVIDIKNKNPKNENSKNGIVKKLIDCWGREYEYYTILSNHHYDAIMEYIIKNLKENGKEFLNECEKNGIKKEDLREILLEDIKLKSIYELIKLIIKCDELTDKYNEIREKKMFGTIKNLKDKSIIIMGDVHAKNLKPKLKELSEKEKRNILVLHQSDILNEEDIECLKFIYNTTHNMN